MKGERNVLFELRYRRRLTQQQLGDLLGVSDATVAGWEKSRARLTEVQAERCARVLGCRVEELLPLCEKDALCLTHEDNARIYERYRKRYDNRKASGICVACGDADNRTREGKAYCAKCYEYQRNSVRRLREERSAEHRCALCGDELPEGYGRKNCERCLAIRNRKENQRKEENTMKYAKAIGILDKIEDAGVPEEDKVAAIRVVIGMPSHSSIPKTVMVRVIRWLFGKIYDNREGANNG